MHQLLGEHGVQVPEQLSSDNLDEICEFIKNKLEFPVVIKPVDSSGTNGVHVCENYDDVTKA